MKTSWNVSIDRAWKYLSIYFLSAYREGIEWWHIAVIMQNKEKRKE